MQNFIFLLTVLMLFSGCCKKRVTPEKHGINCHEFKQAFIDNDKAAYKMVIDSLCQKYPPMPTTKDPIGNQENTNNLIEELNDNCSDIHFELGCYACLFPGPLPSLSKVLVTIDSHNVLVTRTVFLINPPNETMHVH